MKAFPNPNNTKQEGMDLMDYFAAQAMQAYVAKMPNSIDPDDIAECSYNIALAMIQFKKNINKYETY